MPDVTHFFRIIQFFRISSSFLEVSFNEVLGSKLEAICIAFDESIIPPIFPSFDFQHYIDFLGDDSTKVPHYESESSFGRFASDHCHHCSKEKI